MRFYFFILVIIACSNIVAAVSFSPSSLVFKQAVLEKTCQNISFESESEKISLSDFWAENKDIIWNPNLFNGSSSVHKIYLKYPSEVSGKGNVEICLSGKEIGEYHGILFLSEEQKGNSVVRMGVWIKAVILDEEINKKSSGITGAAIGNGIIGIKNIIIGLVSLIIIVIIIIGFIAYRNKKHWKGI